MSEDRRGDIQPGLDPDEQARRLARGATGVGSPTDWFDDLYAAASRGQAVVPWDRGEPHPLLVEWTARAQLDGTDRTALVVGAGLGYDAEHVAALGFLTTAFDVSPTAVDAIRARFPTSPVDYRTADLLDLPGQWRRAFDLVVEIFTVQSMPPRVRPAATAAVADTVSAGGTLLVIGAVGNGQPVDGPPWPLTRAEVDAFGGRGLIAVQVEEIPEPHRWRAEFRRQ